MGCEVICGDVRDLPVRGPFHAILCDPPYNLAQIGRDLQLSRNGDGTDRTQQRNYKERGFMGKEWDNGVAFDPDVWRGLLALLHPGGFGMAFGGSRTYHRLACAIEDAGAVLHPMIGWAYGSGFPKATNISRQVDGAKPRGVGFSVAGYTASATVPGGAHGAYEPESPLAATWSGHRYGLQALKPALEPICCFQRPYEGKPWECITRTGAGAMNIDGARVGTADVVRSAHNVTIGGGGIYQGGRAFETGALPGQGRWPANLVLCHEPGCNGTCEDGCAVRKLGEQSGVLKTGSLNCVCNNTIMANTPGVRDGKPIHLYHPADTGTAARFFTQVGWQLEQAEPLFYQAKAGRRERDKGLETFPLSARPTMGDGIGGQPDQHRENNRNFHPTVKPIALARHLATLLLPPPEYAPRRILVPFAGSGSEMIGAMLAGWEEVVGIELNAEYCDMARARIAHWAQQPALEIA